MWRTKGDFVVRVKAKDEFGWESNWSTLDVAIPKDTVKDICVQFLKDHPYLFSFFKFLWGLHPLYT